MFKNIKNVISIQLIFSKINKYNKLKKFFNFDIPYS